MQHSSKSLAELEIINGALLQLLYVSGNTLQWMLVPNPQSLCIGFRSMFKAQISTKKDCYSDKPLCSNKQYIENNPLQEPRMSNHYR